MTRDSTTSEEKSSRSYWGFVLWPVALIIALGGGQAPAAETNFYQRFLSTSKIEKGFLQDPMLVNTNNSAPIVTNNTLPYTKFAERGELAGVKLGMTMDEVVAAWGKPRELVTRCIIGPRFWYGDALHCQLSLFFEGEKLVLIAIGTPLTEVVRFDNGLTTQM